MADSDETTVTPTLTGEQARALQAVIEAQKSHQSDDWPEEQQVDAGLLDEIGRILDRDLAESAGTSGRSTE